jgi:hypothetical protein
LYKYYMIVSIGDRNFCQGEKEMLMKTLLETYRDVTRQLVPGQEVTTVPVRRAAANSGQWAGHRSDTKARGRRLRRQRRMEGLANRPVNGWTVRTW